MSSQENIGRAAVPQVQPSQHRGAPEYTKEQMARMFPPIRVRGRRREKRAAEPHDYRNNQSDSVGRWLCNLCGKMRFDPESLHFL